MAEEKRKISKVQNAAARQVTFCRRRRGLFKKAQELAILCDVRVGLIVFSSTGELFEFSTSSMKDIIENYNRRSAENGRRLEKPSLGPQLDNEKCDSLGDEMAGSPLRSIIIFQSQLLPCICLPDYGYLYFYCFKRLSGEGIEGLTLNELIQLEKSFEKGLRQVIQIKGQKIIKEVSELHRKAEILMEKNALLKEQVIEMKKGKRLMALQEPIKASHEDREPPAMVTNTSASGGTQNIENTSDTSLKLGVPLSYR